MKYLNWFREVTSGRRLQNKQVTYVTVVGCLLWLAGGTRPDLTYAASTLARYVSNPGPTHHKAMLRVLAYLHHTRDKVLQISPDSTKHLEIYSDASWCTKNSVSGGIVLYMGAMVGWWSRRQKSIALSSAESEYYAASVAGREGIYYRDLVEDLGLGARKPTPLYLDSKAATLLEIRWLSRKRSISYDMLIGSVTVSFEKFLSRNLCSAKSKWQMC